MARSISDPANITRISLVIAILCLMISLKGRDNQIKVELRFVENELPRPLLSTTVSTSSSSWDLHPSTFLSMEDGGEDGGFQLRSLEYDFYRDSCPQAEKVIREMVQEMYDADPSVSAALLRLAFHDCFIEGCDASILLDNAKDIKSEKDAFPNQSLKGFRIIDIIKSRIEEICPGVVSCADTVVIAARDGIMQAGGPFYPLLTGRRDSTQSFPDKAISELPSPRADLSETIESFATRGFDERETVSMLGAHSIGVVHCEFILNRLYNFSGTNKPDPSIDPDFLNEMRSICNGNQLPFTPAASPSARSSVSPSVQAPSTDDASQELSTFSRSPESPSAAAEVPCNSAASEISHEDPEIDMASEGPGVDFGTLYYRRLLQGRGILYSDQQLTAGDETGIWVKAFASDVNLFRHDFTMTMMKLSTLGVLTSSAGQVRVNCSKVA